MSAEKYALLQTFRSLFEGKPYRHRIANLGDLVASYLYEDLVVLGKSARLVERVQHHERVVNLKNLMTGKPSRLATEHLALSGHRSGAGDSIEIGGKIFESFLAG